MPGAVGAVIAAPSSGSGKTTITLGLLRYFARERVPVSSFKIGPDYIDPGFHAAASGRPCLNIDSWAMRSETIASLFGRAGSDTDIVIGEGVMGLFDGAQPPPGASSGTAAGLASGSTADAAALLGLPVILVVDARAQAQSAANSQVATAEEMRALNDEKERLCRQNEQIQENLRKIEEAETELQRATDRLEDDRAKDPAELRKRMDDIKNEMVAVAEQMAEMERRLLEQQEDLERRQARLERETGAGAAEKGYLAEEADREGKALTTAAGKPILREDIQNIEETKREIEEALTRIDGMQQAQKDLIE